MKQFTFSSTTAIQFGDDIPSQGFDGNGRGYASLPCTEKTIQHLLSILDKASAQIRDQQIQMQEMAAAASNLVEYRQFINVQDVSDAQYINEQLDRLQTALQASYAAN